MSDERGLLYVGTDYFTALYRNVTVALEFAASELADLSEEHEAAERAVVFIMEALQECQRVMQANRATPASAPVGETTDTERLDALRGGMIVEVGLSYHRDGTWWANRGGQLHYGDSPRQAIDAARAAERRDQEEGR